MRGLVVNPDRIIVTAGARDGLALLLNILGPSTMNQVDRAWSAAVAFPS